MKTALNNLISTIILMVAKLFRVPLVGLIVMPLIVVSIHLTELVNQKLGQWFLVVLLPGLLWHRNGVEVSTLGGLELLTWPWLVVLALILFLWVRQHKVNDADKRWRQFRLLDGLMAVAYGLAATGWVFYSDLRSNGSVGFLVLGTALVYLVARALLISVYFPIIEFHERKMRLFGNETEYRYEPDVLIDMMNVMELMANAIILIPLFWPVSWWLYHREAIARKSWMSF